MTESAQSTAHHLAAFNSVPTFLKWAGGKRQLLDALRSRLPRRFGRYHEPFVGSGALFFSLRQDECLPQGALLADANPHLVQVYEALRDIPDGVIAALKEHPYDKDHYYEVRDRDPERLEPHERAARFLYLNRAGFNGLYRENSKGKFNVPFGRYKNPTICPEDRLRAASHALQGVEIRCADFEAVAAEAAEGDLVYFDPPYVPLNDTSYFTSYRKGGFGAEDQRRLAETFRRLAARGVHVVLSNSDAPLVHELYDGERIDRVLARRAINSKAGGRGAIHEVIVRPAPRESGPSRRHLP